MQREIRFRAWDAQENKMNTNGCIGAGSSGKLIIIEWQAGLSACNAYGLSDGTNPTWDTPVTERFKLMQYTSVKNKNSTDIYEGDILKYKYELDANGEGGTNSHYEKFEIKFINGAFRVGEVPLHDFILELEPDEGYEIIGNIYENPELLKQT